MTHSLVRFAVKMSVLIGIALLTNTLHAEPTPLFQYTVTWSANTEADMAGYILESSDTLAGPWSIVDDNIPFGTNTKKVIYPVNSKYFRVSAFDKSKNVSGPSTPAQGKYITDNVKPVPPGSIAVAVIPVEEVVKVPDVSSPKLTVSGKSMTLSWDPQNAETQIWMANSSQASKLLNTVGANGANLTITGSVSGWHCFTFRHKIGTALGEWANANPADPSDINFCTSIP